MNQDQVMGLVRHALTAIGGIVIAKGLASDGNVQEIIGALMTLAGVIWSIKSKKTPAA
jgi:hypothetical protein